MNEIYFTGTIERIVFENPSNFYKILLLDITDTNAEYAEHQITVTGTMSEVFEQEEYCFYGHLVTHPKYGPQLQISRYERSKPTYEGLIHYFSSSEFKGIGRKTAEKIVKLYGENSIDNILAAPEKLSQISGLSEQKRLAFLEKLQLNYGAEIILAQLATYGIPNKLALQIQKHYKEKTLEVIEKNPYQLVEDIQGVGFTIADRIAENLGIDSNAPQRFRAGLLFCLMRGSMESGHTYLEAQDLLAYTLELLEKSRNIELDPKAIAKELTNLITDGKIQQEDTKVFDNTLYFAEQGIHKNVERLMEQENSQSFSRNQIEEAIAVLETESDLTYDKIQKEAIFQAITNPLFILTGGPGTGKTTVINGIIAVYALLHKLDLSNKTEESPILLAAPTGRAARRMNELTGLPAATIHRHLGLTEGQEESYLDDWLEADFIIIDEFSMVDTWLAHQLFQHISSYTQVLIVGDAEQLPSVNPGQVLADLLQVKSIPSITLEKIYRQSDSSTIVTLASHVRQGILPNDFREKKADRSYFEAGNDQIPSAVQKIISAATKSGIPAQDIQILAPMYRGSAGIDQLNSSTQALLNPLKEGQLEFPYKEQVFRTGDRVLHLVNDAQANVFNGDIGYITDLLAAKYTESKQDELIINFDGNEITYPHNEWYKITLAYAMSIHKSQGSEFQVVILPITRTSQRMLQRNLLYTAITRSKNKLILLGEIAAFDLAIRHTGASRKTYLVQRFQQDQQTEDATPKVTATSPNQPSILLETGATPPPAHVLTVEAIGTIDPMIGISQEECEAFFHSQK